MNFIHLLEFAFEWMFTVLSLKYKISENWLVETGWLFPKFLIATVQVSMEYET